MESFFNKVLVFSDSHGDVNRMLEICKRHNEINTVIHLGDCVRDALALESSFPNISLFSICGNNDFGYNKNSEETIVLDSKRIFITHGQNYRVKTGILYLSLAAIEKQVDAALFGHTHSPYCQTHGGILFANPGSVSNKNRSTYGIMTISHSINFEILEYYNV